MGNDFQDHYEVLGVASTATAEEIKRAYLARARQVHPDLQKTRLTLKTEWTKEVNEASQVLGDPARRARYDREREARQGPAPGGPDATASPPPRTPPQNPPPEGRARSSAPRQSSRQEKPRRSSQQREGSPREGSPSQETPRAARSARKTSAAPSAQRSSLLTLALIGGNGLQLGIIVMLLVLWPSAPKPPAAPPQRSAATTRAASAKPVATARPDLAPAPDLGPPDSQPRLVQREPDLGPGDTSASIDPTDEPPSDPDRATNPKACVVTLSSSPSRASIFPAGGGVRRLGRTPKRFALRPGETKRVKLARSGRKSATVTLSCGRVKHHVQLKKGFNPGIGGGAIKIPGAGLR